MRAAIQLVALAVVISSASLVRGQESKTPNEPPDWWKAQRDVGELLLAKQADLPSLARKMADTKAASVEESLQKLNVLLRAGMPREAIAALQELKMLAPDLPGYQIESIYFSACDHFAQWEVARAAVEVFANRVSGIDLENRLLKHFRESGWSVEQIDRWLANKPAGRDNFWVKQRLRFNVEAGRGDALVAQLTDEIRKQPHDIGKTVAFLDALIYAHHAKADLSWMAQSLKPQRATEAERLASRLAQLSQPAAAMVFYERAIERPLVNDEIRELTTMSAMVVSDEATRAMFAAHVREEMARCLLNLDRAAESQKWMVEAADIRQKHGFVSNALFAGQVQAASGQRVIEGRIRQEEQRSADDPAYWRERAAYYRGRAEAAQEEEALKKGLALARPTAEPRTGREMDWRRWLLQDYAQFLQRQNRTKDAVALLRKELAEAPATSSSAEGAAQLLAMEFAQQVGADDDVLWNWLAQRKTWSHAEERLLWRMLESALPHGLSSIPAKQVEQAMEKQPGDLAKRFAQAEQMVHESDPSRAATLGWIMNRMGFPKRSIPLLEQAVAKATDVELKQRTAFTLFESYLDTDLWKQAEDVLPIARQRLTPRELPEWHAKIAVAAAKSGAKADALRLWKATANLDATVLGPLGDLAKAGLKDELADFYRQMQQTLPSSTVPAEAMKRLTVTLPRPQ